MPSIRSSYYGFLVGTLALVAACHDDTSPNPHSEAFDANHALATFEPVAAVFDQSIFRSFEGVLPVFEHFFRSGDSSPGIPVNAIGSTFVYDPTTKLYVTDPKATGAPATGVRFVLYAWDATLLGPAAPLTRIGYVDLTPATGAGSQEATRIVIVRDTNKATISDFVISHGTSGTDQSFGITGSATDGSTPVNIAVDGTRTQSNGHRLVFNSTLSSAPLGIRLTEQLTFDQSTAAQGGKLELDYAGHTLTDENVGTGLEVKFDGALYTRVVFPSVGGEPVQYFKPDGAPLAEREVVDLTALLNRVVATNFFWIELAWP